MEIGRNGERNHQSLKLQYDMTTDFWEWLWKSIHQVDNENYLHPLNLSHQLQPRRLTNGRNWFLIVLGSRNSEIKALVVRVSEEVPYTKLGVGISNILEGPTQTPVSGCQLEDDLGVTGSLNLFFFPTHSLNIFPYCLLLISLSIRMSGQAQSKLEDGRIYWVTVYSPRNPRQEPGGRNNYTPDRRVISWQKIHIITTGSVPSSIMVFN